jgi:ABC-type dipeptide/oligopeptide/nickel transport system ATPase component
MRAATTARSMRSTRRAASPPIPERAASASDPLLEIENLKVIFHGDRGSATHAVDGLDLTIQRGQTLGLVGESGCGKTATALSVMDDGAELLSLPDRAMRNLRGDQLAMIFQEPMSSLNPSYSIGECLYRFLPIGKQSKFLKPELGKSVRYLINSQVFDPDRNGLVRLGSD